MSLRMNDTYAMGVDSDAIVFESKRSLREDMMQKWDQGRIDASIHEEWVTYK